ncbi:MAG: LacI family DNA-binding transcriptional regulator [Spirochaetales bacterium]|nr:LacI family DNA-binding transcriptional regulator [Spirochaetales bacterium]
MGERKRVTIKDIAREVGVSAHSVSLALNNQGRISEPVRKKILETADRMNYRPNILARGLVQGRTYLLGFICPAIHESFFASILSGVEEKCSRKGYDVILGNAFGRDIKTESDALSRILDRKVDGIIAAPDPRAYSVYEPLVSEGIPFVQIMTRIPGLNAPSLSVDNEYGGYIAARHLIELGHSNIGFINTDLPFYEEISQRYKGYTRALLSLEQSVNPQQLSVACENLIDIEQSKEAAKKLLMENRSISAVFAPTDHAAIGVVNACLELGKRVPEDISVIGFDDIDLAHYQIMRPLTTISQPKQEQGYLAFEMIEQLISGEKISDRIIKPELITRTTTAKFNK